MNVLRPRTLALFASTALVAAGPLVATPAHAQEGPFVYLPHATST